MAFITVDQLRTRLASALRVASNDTTIDSSSPWQQILTDSVSWGYEEILSALVNRGYTKTQVDTWSRGIEYNVSLGLYWAFTMGAGLHSYDDKWVNKLDRRLELENVLVLDSSGEIIVGDDDGRVRGGLLTTDNDYIVPIDPDDPQIGEPIQW